MKVGDVEFGSSSDNPETPLFVQDNDSELWVSEVVKKEKVLNSHFRPPQEVLLKHKFSASVDYSSTSSQWARSILSFMPPTAPHGLIRCKMRGQLLEARSLISEVGYHRVLT
jgi:hypothetical protein